MPRLMALEWDGREVRVAVARSRGKELVLEQAFAVDLAAREGQTPAQAQAALGARLEQVVRERHLAKQEAIVAVGRSNIELRQMSLPPCPPEELPDMVRFQALRQFANIGEDWALDFVPIDGRDAEMINVLAAALSPEAIKQIQHTCEQAHLRPIHLVLRPFAAASLLRRQQGEASGCRMMVDILAEEADLTVLLGDQVVFLRTVRLPHEEEAQPRALLGEIRRTIVAAQNQLGGRAVERIVLFAEGKDPSALQALLGENLTVPVDLCDPFAGIEQAPELSRARPEHAGRFAPLLGMLLDQVSETRPAIDFLHPRQRPVKQDRRRQAVLLGGVVAAAVAALVFMVWSQLSSLDEEIAALRGEIARGKKSVQQAQKQRADWALVEQFQAADVTWLDQLLGLATRLPPADEVVLDQVRVMAIAKGGGQIVLEGSVARSEVIDRMEKSLRDQGVRVRGAGAKYDDRNPRYPWQFTETVTITGEESSPAPATPPTTTPLRPAANAAKGSSS